MNYVLGFMFDKKKEYVLLVRKNRPAWQRGKLNGIGGKLESGESYDAAMIREFKEETGIQTYQHQWQFFGEMMSHAHEDSFSVAMYRAFSDEVFKAVQTTDEPIFLVKVDLNELRLQGTPELAWQLAMAMSNPGNFATFHADVYYQNHITKRNA
jgi:8-oxo-dGTP diphosphatase